MKNRVLLSFLAAAAVVGVLGFTANSASAQALRGWNANIPVPFLTPQPNDLHLTFTGTGGTIANVAVTPVPASATVVGGNKIEIVWGIGAGAKLAAGTPVNILFTTTTAGVALNVGQWTNDGNATGPAFDEDAEFWDMIAYTPSTPGASPMVMMLIALAIAGAGTLVLVRRRAVA